MRKGISLMEMLVAIILLGILSSVGFTYYKNYYSTA
ncbi:MAG: prepilin-type N-terminal cleavage/methylation domain-containing protein, partial [Sulfurimonas sp.]|nr:prepilin-type N-terminal cleavage/methylation domain-containing protein [Sulfurimonas sp.]